VRIPKIHLAKGDPIVDSGAVLKRLKEIEELLTGIAHRMSSPLWIPHAGEVGYQAWRDYDISDHVQMPYPGTRLAQPAWFEHDLGGFYTMEHWCYLKHEQVTLMKATNRRIPEEDHAWAG
jgi:hypothetical protein